MKNNCLDVRVWTTVGTPIVGSKTLTVGQNFTKISESWFFEHLGCSDDFLTMRNGFSAKFPIDIGVQIWSSILKTRLVVPDYIHIRRNLGFGVLTPVTVATNRLSGTGTCTNCFWVSKMLFSRKTCAGVLRTGHLSLVQQHTLHVVHLLPVG